MTDEEMKKILERVEKLEKESKAKDEKITKLESDNKELMSKIVTAKVDSLAREVEEVKPLPKEDEETTFDFDF